MRYLDYSSIRFQEMDRKRIRNLTMAAVTMDRIPFWKKEYPEALDLMEKRRRVEDVVCSHAIEGMYRDEKRLMQLISDPGDEKDINDLKILSLYNSIIYIESLESVPELTLEHLLELHRTLMSQYDPNGGKLRAANIPHRGHGSASIIYEPTTLTELNYVIRHFFRSLNECLEGDADPTVASICATLDLFSISPFDNGNGRMYRLMLYLLLRRSGIEIIRYVSLNKQLYQDSENHLHSISKSTHGWGTSKLDYYPFLDNVVDNLVECCREMNRMLPHPVYGRLSKSERIRYVVERMEGRFTREDIEYAVPDISRIYIQKELSKMIDSLTVVKYGTTRDATYAFCGPVLFP